MLKIWKRNDREINRHWHSQIFVYTFALSCCSFRIHDIFSPESI